MGKDNNEKKKGEEPQEPKTQREYKYTRNDFAPLPVRVLHHELSFDIYNTYTKTTATLYCKTREKRRMLALDAKNLEIKAVSVQEATFKKSTKSKQSLVLKKNSKPLLQHYQYDPKNDKLILLFTRAVPRHTLLAIQTIVIIRPTHHLLEGLYYDATPPGAPPQQITQCQQWGFERLTPCFDDMTAKCTYTTSITADKRYTHIISNGRCIIDKKPISANRVLCVYENTTPMAPYLFFLGVGTYAEFAKEVEYPQGKKIRIELLVPPQSNQQHAQEALDILHEGILWVYLFTGKDADSQYQRKKQILDLLMSKHPHAKAKAHQLAKTIHGGYVYTGDCYREIGMQNSDYGGMENLGNTTILTNRIMPFEQMTDAAYEYLIQVKVHEFYHNINGSEVTGANPFCLWLNEAVTVHIEKKYFAYKMGNEYARFDTILQIIAPHYGVLDQDSGPAAMPIEPEGFNSPNELITGITYVKAPEVVRMIETIIGKKAFAKGLARYHQQFKGRNATPEDWIACMEKESGRSLSTMAKQWLKQKGYPVVTIVRKNQLLNSKQRGNNKLFQNKKKSSEKQTLLLSITQSPSHPDEKKSCWTFPLQWAIYDKKGNLIKKKVSIIKKKNQEIAVTLNSKKREQIGFFSFNQDLSFYGKCLFKASSKELFRQVHYDPTLSNRFFAFQELLNREKLQLLQNPKKEVSKPLRRLYAELLQDKKITERIGSGFFVIFEEVSDLRFRHAYEQLYLVRKKILQAIAKEHEQWLYQEYENYEKRLQQIKSGPGTATQKRLASIRPRQMKLHLLMLLASTQTKQANEHIKKCFQTATNATEQYSALRRYLESTLPDKEEVLWKYSNIAKNHPVSWESFLGIVAGADLDAQTTVRLIEKAWHHPAFSIVQSNDQRALFGTFARKKRICLLTPQGRELLKKIILTLAPINEYTTTSIIKTLSVLEYLNKKDQIALMEIGVTILQQLSEKQTPSVYGTLRIILKNSEKAAQAYCKAKKIPALPIENV
ncbi:MAG: M1 family metallopeptidase [Candidatus Woesearchaeota archaeon]